MIQWKEKCKEYYPGQPLLTYGYYKKFMKRNVDEINSSKVKVRDVKQKNWGYLQKHENFV